MLNERIPFYIRIKKNTLVEYSNGKIKKAYCFFTDKQKGARTGAKLGKDNLNLAGKYLGKGEYLIIATNVTVKNALTIYKERWQIELFFSCLKTRGFRLEETHMSDPEKN